jgi:hypothetical protein
VEEEEEDEEEEVVMVCRAEDSTTLFIFSEEAVAEEYSPLRKSFLCCNVSAISTSLSEIAWCPTLWYTGMAVAPCSD